MRPSSDVLKMLMLTAELFGRELSEGAAQMLAMDLALYESDAVVKALSRCRMEVPRFPTIADILARLDDGHPGPEEAWAMLPKSEDDSVVWTDEIAQAYGVVACLIRDGGEVEARMAFKEVYSRLLGEARAVKRAPRWKPSFGFDPRSHDAAVRIAVDKRRITHADAVRLLPNYGTPKSTQRQQITGTIESSEPTQAAEAIKSILDRLQNREEEK